MGEKAVQIISTTGEGRFTLNKSALNEILNNSKIRNKPVCVISIAGTYRQGKSFFLNFLLRYLNLKYNTHVQDMSDFLTPEYGPLEGFNWKAGSEPNTLGILMWPEVFLADVKGKEVAIILMDTQGTFDHQTSYSNCATIFALSTLISSCQIYNVLDNISQDVLNHLECFAEYGKWARSDSAPFQKLLFLVRDYRWPEDYGFGIKGGAQILKKILKTTGNEPPEVKTLRENVKNLFSKIDCALMPSPGAIVCKSGDFKGELDDIEEDFLIHVNKLVPLILEPENLTVKQINGDTVTAGELYHYIESYIKRFQSEDKPQMKSVYMAMVDANHLVAVGQAEQKYKDLIDNAVENSDKPYLGDTQLQMSLEKAELEAMRSYQRKKKFGNVEKVDEKYTKILEDKLRTISDEFKKINEAKKLHELGKIEMEHETISRTCLQNYTSKMEELISSSFPEDGDLLYLHRNAKDEFLKYFEDKTANSPRDVKTKYMNELQNEIKVKFEEIEKKNQSARHNNLAMSKLTCENTLMKATEMYKNSIDKIIEAYDDNEFLKIHNDAEKSAIEFFTKETTSCHGSITKELLAQLKNQIKELHYNYSALNKKRLEQENVIVQLRLENVLTRSVEKYRKIMERNMSDMGCEDSELTVKHNSAKEDVTKFFQNEAGDVGANIDPFLKKLQEQIKACLEEVRLTLVKKRDENRSLSRLRHEYALKNAIEKYKEILEITLPKKSLNEDKLTEIHKECKDKALKLYRNEMDNVSSEDWYQGFYDDTKMKVEEASEQYFQINAARIKEENVKISSQHEGYVRDALEIYKKNMESSINEESLLDFNELRNEHLHATEEAMDYFEQITEDSSQDFRLQYLAILEKRIKELYKDYKNKNSSNNDSETPNSTRIKYEGAVKRAEDSYRRIMDNHLSHNSLDRSTMRNNHESARILAVNSYESDTLGNNKKHLAEEYRKILEMNLFGLLQQYMEENDAKRDRKILDKEKLSKTADSSFKTYEQAMDELWSNGEGWFKSDQLEKAHGGAKKQAIKRFQEFAKSVASGEDKDELMEGLEEKIDDKFYFYIAKNKQNEELLTLQEEKKCLLALLSAQNMYRDLIDQMFEESTQRENVLEKDDILQTVDLIYNRVIAHYKENPGKNQKIYEKYFFELQQYLQRERFFEVRG